MSKSDIRIDVSDMRQLNRALRQVDKDLAKQQRQMNKEAAETVAKQTRIETPKRSQKLVRTVKVRATQTSASVKMGTKSRLKYAPPIHFGWAKRNIDRNPAIYRAIIRKRKQVRKTYEQGLNNLIKKAGLGRRF